MRSGAAPRKCTTTGLPAAAAASSIWRAIAGAGGLEISTITRVPRIGGQRGEPLQHRDAADLFLQVAAAGAERLRDAAAQVVDAAGHFLQPGARRRDEADVAAPHDVGKAERHAVDDRRAAIGPHHQQVFARARTVLIARSSSTDTLSENSITCRPSASAFIASAAA